MHKFLIGTHVDHESLEQGEDPNDYVMTIGFSIPKMNIAEKFDDDEEILKRAAVKIISKIKHEGEVTKARQQDNLIASFINTGDIKLFNSNDSQEICTLKGHEGEGFGLDIFKDILVSGSQDKTVKVWKLD